MTRRPAMWTVIFAWVPVWLLHTLAIIHYGDVSLGRALVAGFDVVAIAAALGFGVWRFVKRHPWPQRPGFRFFGIHIAAAAAFSGAWLIGVDLLEALVQKRAPLVELLQTREFMWWLLSGMWIYGMVAGISYAVLSTNRLREVQERAAKAEALAARAQLAALRGQLNPHFLFNALHSVSSLIRRDTKAAERAVERLGNLLRYTLDEENRQEVRLADEWDFVCQYLELEQLRFDDRLRIESDIESEALNALLPSFALQTLVENAVRHGIGPKIGASVLRIRSCMDGDVLVIQVGDDGIGAVPEAVPQAKGLGLRALRQRLAAEYHGNASLTVVTAPGGGFAVTARIPQGPSLIMPHST